MLNVNAKELRIRLSYYLDKIEEGEEVTIVRNSSIIGSLKPANPKPTPEEEAQMKHELADGRVIEFRRVMPYDDNGPFKELYLTVSKATGAYVEPEGGSELDFDLNNLWAAYVNMKGDFIIGELEGQVVAMGGYRLNLTGEGGPGLAELKRMRVSNDLQGRGIGSKVLDILEKSAKNQGYEAILLDTTDKQPQAGHFYEKHGYAEFKRKKAKKFTLIYYKKAL